MVSNSDVGLSNSNISIFNAPSASVETISRLREEIQNLQMQLKECSLNQVKLVSIIELNNVIAISFYNIN